MANSGALDGFLPGCHPPPYPLGRIAMRQLKQPFWLIAALALFWAASVQASDYRNPI